MPSRRLLNNVASGLLGTFVSRNNDVDGYWALGRLRSLADKRHSASVTIDVLRGIATPTNRDTEQITRTYRTWLANSLNRHRFAANSVTAAEIDLTFGSWAGVFPPGQTTWGDPFTCRVTIIDDLGRVHSRVVSGWCAPHSPSRESRSTHLQPRSAAGLLRRVAALLSRRPPG